jgi:hypothetical protein
MKSLRITKQIEQALDLGASRFVGTATSGGELK